MPDYPTEFPSGHPFPESPLGLHAKGTGEIRDADGNLIATVEIDHHIPFGGDE